MALRREREAERRARHRALWARQATEAEARERETLQGLSNAAKLMRQGNKLPTSMGGGDPTLSSAQRLSSILSVGPANGPYRTLGGGV